MAEFIPPARYWGVDDRTAGTFPLGLRHSNNLFNIKYFQGAERNQNKWPGLLGPSVARDQGDPQMLFANPEDSGVAAAGLLRRKYDSGMRSPQSIIAGRSGWTPGHTMAPGNVARLAGVGVNDDLKLDTPEGMRRFLPALAEQEHGKWMADRYFTPEMYDKITERSTGAQFASGALPPLAPLAADGSNAHRWGSPLAGVPTTPGAPSPARPAMPTAMALGNSPAAPAAPAPTPGNPPMADPQDDSFINRFQNPLTQTGLGILMSAMQGGDLNQGASAGAQRGNMALEQLLQQRKLQQQEMQRRALQQAIGGSETFRNMSPGDRAFLAANPEAAQQLLVAQAKSRLVQDTPAAQAELEGQRLQNQIRQRQLEKPLDPVQLGQNEAAARRAQIEAAGIDPNTPAAKSFIASGKMPREDQQPLTATDKKAILEADEMVLNTQGVIKALDEAKVLSKKAYTGPTAQLRGYGASLIGAEGGQETEELTNLITNNALQQLKATFGAAPTEGERKILMEIQGSVNKAPRVREAIFERARVLAENRLNFYSKRAEEMRGGDYFKGPKAQGAQPQAAPAAPGGFSIRRLD